MPIEDESARSLRIFKGEEFTKGFVPPDFLIDGILQRRYLYSLTAQTHHGKTTLALHMAFCVAHGSPFANRQVERGKVLILIGENPDDVRARMLVAAIEYGLPINDNLVFVEGPFDIERKFVELEQAAKLCDGFSLVIVDTSAAFFTGENENDNVEAGKHARKLRQLTRLPGQPAVLVCCHPTKNAGSENLTPRGGGAFLGEVDGNLTVWLNQNKIARLSYNKLRGPDFDPIRFELAKATTDSVVDTKGRPISSVVARPLEGGRFTQKEQENQKLLGAMLKNLEASVAGLATVLYWMTGDLETPHKSKVSRALCSLEEQKLVRKNPQNHWVLTPEGRSLADEFISGSAD